MKLCQMLLILIVTSLITGCTISVRPSTVVCVQRIDWEDNNLFILTDQNKKAILILDDYCDLKVK